MLIHWLAWLFSWGRFSSPQPPSGQNLRFIFSEAAVKIINDFRHLLALVVVLIFALVLGYAMIRAGKEARVMHDSLQAVVASLGGLVGSIIGYYFGESAVTRAREAEAPSRDSGGKPPPQVQNGPPLPEGQPVPPIKEAPPPPGQPPAQG